MNKTHGIRNTRIYEIWKDMKKRCFNPNCAAYHLYGGRGIIVCEKWKDNVKDFYDWAMQNGYTDKLTLDRIDVNGNYEPSNCRWVTKKEQANNTRRNHQISYNGKTQTLQQWADELGISRVSLRHRICDYHWSIEKALTTPIRQHK